MIDNAPPAPLLHPFLAPRDGGAPISFVRGEGCHLFDAAGRTWIDAFSGLWCVNLGYGRRDIIAAATHQMESLAYHSTFWGQASEASLALARKLVDIAPASLTHVFFTLGGSDANDTAMKVLHLVNAAEGKPEKRHFLSFTGSYHGASYATTGLTGLTAMHANLAAPFDFQHQLPAPFDGRPWDRSDPGAVIAGTIAAIDSAVANLGVGTVAGLFVEPILGTGGVIVPPDGWLAAVERQCRMHGIALIVDEVMTGFGRTGAMFASTREGVMPDMMALAKGLTSAYVPMGALMLSAELVQRIDAAVPAGGSWQQGFTYSGHPVAAATGLACIAAYENEQLCQRSATLGESLHHRLSALGERHEIIGDVRGRGLLLAIELCADRQGFIKPASNPRRAVAIRRIAYDHGLICRVFPGEVIALAPPLTISAADADMIVDRLDATLAIVADRFILKE